MRLQCSASTNLKVLVLGYLEFKGKMKAHSHTDESLGMGLQFNKKAKEILQ